MTFSNITTFFLVLMHNLSLEMLILNLNNWAAFCYHNNSPGSLDILNPVLALLNSIDNHTDLRPLNPDTLEGVWSFLSVWPAQPWCWLHSELSGGVKI